MDRIGKKDKAVIRAFTERRALDGHKLTTDGTRLDIYGLGGNDIAHWKGDKIHFPGTHGSRSGQLVERAVAREAPKNDLFNGRGFNPDEAMVYVDPDLGARVMEWHGGQGTSLYAVGSSSIAGNAVPLSIVDEAIANLFWLSKKAKKRAEKDELRNLARQLDDAILDAAGEQNPTRVANSHDPRQSAREFRATLDRANENIVEGADAGVRGQVEKMIGRFIAAAMWIGRAGAELKYAGAGEVDRDRVAQYQDLAEGLSTWGNTIVQYMRDEMGIAANPSRKRTSTSKAACTVGASAHKSRAAAARQCGSGWKASKTKFASTGGKAAARSPKSPIGKRKRRRSR